MSIDPEGTITAALWRARIAKRINRAVNQAAIDSATAERARILRKMYEYAEYARNNPHLKADTLENAIKLVRLLGPLPWNPKAKARTKPATVRGRKGKK
jgi:hypothetical protein